MAIIMSIHISIYIWFDYYIICCYSISILWLWTPFNCWIYHVQLTPLQYFSARNARVRRTCKSTCVSTFARCVVPVSSMTKTTKKNDREGLSYSNRGQINFSNQLQMCATDSEISRAAISRRAFLAAVLAVATVKRLCDSHPCCMNHKWRTK